VLLCYCLSIVIQYKLNILVICNWIQTARFKLYCEYTYKKKEKTTMVGDNTQLFGRITVNSSC
jgi:hypothetical protein